MKSYYLKWVEETHMDVEAELKGTLYLIERLKREIADIERVLNTVQNSRDKDQTKHLTKKITWLNELLERNEQEAKELIAYSEEKQQQVLHD